MTRDSGDDAMRWLVALLAIWLLATAPAARAGPGDARPPDPPPKRNHVAAVIGVSTYTHLPSEIELDFARSDAALVARTLRENAGFDEVFLLTDGQATREGIRDLLRTKVPQVVGRNDLLVVYFAGHGVGADLELPVLLAHDSTLQNGQEDGLELQGFARDLQTWLPAGQMLVVTDAIHRNQLDGIHFYGPAATQWPPLRKGAMLLSSSQPESPAVDGAFGKVFADAVGGAADVDRDGSVTASELFAYVLNQLSPGGQVPVAAGDFDPDMVIARGVGSTGATGSPRPTPDAATVRDAAFPDHPIDKAKFVWADGASQTVHCRGVPVTACGGDCYVWGFRAGPCRLTAVVDGTVIEGEVVVLRRGLYRCQRSDDTLACTGP